MRRGIKFGIISAIVIIIGVSAFYLVLIGGPDVNYFDCGDGNDVIIDFNPAIGDTQADNCEVVLTDLGDKEFYSQGGIAQSKLQALGVGSFEAPVDLEEIGETID